MSLQQRNQITPQMADYDRVGDQWVPYLMRADAGDRKFASVCTDRWGLRNTVGRNSRDIGVDSIKDLSPDAKIGVVLGSSAVFGVGASSDRGTVASWLNAQTELNWLNLGGRAYNSTQELLLLVLHLPRKLDTVVVMSGVNNLTLSYLSDSPSPVYNSFFLQSLFQKAMSNPENIRVGVKKAFRGLWRELRGRISAPPRQLARSEIGDVYGTILCAFERDLRAIAAVAGGLGARVVFALQPLATWLDRQFSAEETKIFGILDSMSPEWQVLGEHLRSVRGQYFADVEQICRSLDVSFANINVSPEFQRTDEWLFVDRVHLTDLGYRRASEVIRREFSL